MKFKADYKFGEDDQFRIETGDQIFCLELASVQYMYSDTDNVVSMHHWLILRLKGGMIDIYERIVILHARDDNPAYSMFDCQLDEVVVKIV
jgi:hypothetical protein